MSATFYSSLVNPCTRFVNNLVYAAVGIIGAVSVISTGFTVGQLTLLKLRKPVYETI